MLPRRGHGSASVHKDPPGGATRSICETRESAEKVNWCAPAVTFSQLYHVQYHRSEAASKKNPASLHIKALKEQIFR